ncbi:MAG: transcription-repair coupling factor [Bacilli bacterium]|nr:transcription-repair coupling factor [Bacilli bacterium]
MNIFAKLKNSKAIPPFLRKKGHFVVDDTMGISLLTATSYKLDNEKYLLITSNLYNAQQIYNSLTSILDKEEVLLFPADELVRAEAMAQSKEMSAQRLYVLDEIISNRAKIVVANLSSALRYLPSPDLFRSRTLKFRVSEHYSYSEIKKSLVKLGYSLVSKIDQSLQFAVRGDVLDIYSVNNDYPVRIEFFDDEIESIRFFDLASQTSIKKVDEITILPASDLLLTDNEQLNAADKLFDILEKDKEIVDPNTFEMLRTTVEDILPPIMEGQMDEKLYKYYSLLSSSTYSIFDYCKDFTKILINEESLESSNSLLFNESHQYLGELFEAGKCISHLETYQDLHNLISDRSAKTIVTSSLMKSQNDVIFDIKSVPYVSNKTSDAFNIISNYLNDKYTVILALSSHEHILTIEEGLENFGIEYEPVNEFDLPEKAKVGVCSLNLTSGFVLNEEKIVYLTSYELFNEKVRSHRFDNRFKEATILKSYEDLTPGDYVVHEYQGIGQFVGLETIETDGVHKDYLKIAYWSNEHLYVPLSQFQLVRKYLGKEGMTPRLSHLHSKDWENTKKRVKERVNELATRLMNLYKERSKIKGFAFQKDDEFQNEFENSFPYPLTKDQDKAIREIKADMEKDFPMDRLLCGDVGFGKTEVAFRAAMKAILSGKQVALLCPTTLLARQHYEIALKRFLPFDVNIAIFSRLIPEKQQTQYIKEIAEGKIHLAIGTHRLLSKEIHFKDLGLLIIDEEQRFGVEQKEKIKELKTNIDVLTLSATPIPRTLQISLLGVRSMSKIDTPPQDRMPIQTYVTPFDLNIAKELIERELGRHGQVFFLHNNVSTLYLRAHKLQTLLPNARIGVAHGKMTRDDIEDVMMKFYKNEIDVLVCTSIVENGIDVPNANMIIVEDSEMYGLSQLYQIKGRVGRSDRIAYAYLMYSGGKVLNEKAQKRLKALQEFTELGSGYKIAQRDLMIRGAGDILGPEQAGFIDSIGLDMYIKLLNEAVKEKLDGVETTEETVSINPTLSLEAYIPDSFAKDSEKIELYQEIMGASCVDSLASIKLKTKDMYGKLPKEVETLFVKRNIDLLVKEANVDKVEETSKALTLELGKDFINIRGIGNILFEALIPFLSIVKISYAQNIFKIQIQKRTTWLNDLENVLKSLVNIIEHNKIKEVI